jgi:hypothetical protein
VGFPIQTSPDQSLVGSSPRLFAASYVFHRLSMPRHPPCALNNLTTKILKMLASTVQFSNYGRVPELLGAYQVSGSSSETQVPIAVRLEVALVSGPELTFYRPLRTQQRAKAQHNPSSPFHAEAVLDVSYVLSQESTFHP